MADIVINDRIVVPDAAIETRAVRASDEKGNTQIDEPVWNPGGYLWNRIERQEFTVGTAE